VTLSGCHSNRSRGGSRRFPAGLDPLRPRLDVQVLDEEGRTVDVLAVQPDADGNGCRPAEDLSSGRRQVQVRFGIAVTVRPAWAERRRSQVETGK
jgi:hypothetical protein